MRLLLLAFLLVSAPCFAAPETIEGFRFGGSADEIVTRMGEPTAIDGPAYKADSKAWIWSWDYSRYGALFEVEAETQDGLKIIRSLTIVAPCPWKLGSGLGIGDSADEVERAYPNLRKSDPTLWFAPAGDRRNVTGFEFENSRVKSIFIGGTSQ